MKIPKRSKSCTTYHLDTYCSIVRKSLILIQGKFVIDTSALRLSGWVVQYKKDMMGTVHVEVGNPMGVGGLAGDKLSNKYKYESRY